MAYLDSSLEADQALASDRIENRRQLQDVTVSDGVSGVSNTSIDAKKSRTALLTGLETLMGAVEQGANASNGSASDAEKGKGPVSSAPPASSKGPDGKDGKDAKKTPVEKKPTFVPVGLAELQASQKFQDSSNEIIKNLADMSNEIMDATTAQTKSGTDWLKNYYDYGLSSSESNSSDGIGQWKKGTAVKGGDISAEMRIENGKYFMSVDGGKTFKDLGAVDYIPGDLQFVDQPALEKLQAAFPGYTWKTDSTTVAANRNNTWWHSGGGGTGDGNTFTMTVTAPDRTTGGTGISNSSTNDMQDKLKQYTYIQDINSQRNTSMQTISSLPSALESAITGSVDKAHSSDKAILSAQDAVTNMLKSHG